jgi:uncharacterized protein YndB with AHSA1/START domain
MSARNKLAVTTPSDHEIAITRDFDAPRALVWEMFTRPEHVRQWWGHKHLEVTVCEIDLRVGGTYRYAGRTPDGTEVPFKGVYREIAAPERLVYTEIYDVPMARDHEGVVTTTFVEKAGKTTVHSVVRYDTKETRDVVLGSGMEHGVASGYDQIDRMIEAQLRKAG